MTTCPTGMVVSFHYPHIGPHIFICTWLRRQRKVSLDCIVDLWTTRVWTVQVHLHTEFFSINIVSVFSLPDTLNNIFFPLTYLTVKILYILPTPYKLLIDLFLLLVRLLVNSRLLVVKFWEVKSSMHIFDHSRGLVPLTLLYSRVSCILEEYMYMLRKFIACKTFLY